jgi:hypothetical protein
VGDSVVLFGVVGDRRGKRGREFWWWWWRRRGGGALGLDCTAAFVLEIFCLDLNFSVSKFDTKEEGEKIWTCF